MNKKKKCSVCEKDLGKTYWEIMEIFGTKWVLYCNACWDKKQLDDKNGDSKTNSQIGSGKKEFV